MQNDELLIYPEKLQALKKQLELRLERRKKARELLLLQTKSNLIDKIKSLFNI